MKKRSFFGIICFIITAIFIVSCTKGNPLSNVDDQNAFIAQVGYEWEIPNPNNISNYSVKVKPINEDKELEIVNGKVHFDTIGEYEIIYSNNENIKKASVVVTDTEKPKFSKFWNGEWRDNVIEGEYITIPAEIGDSVNINDYFSCVDNSGQVEVSYKVLRGGVDEISLDKDGCFVVENTDYYWIHATAKDASNNFSYAKYKVKVKSITSTDTFKNLSGGLAWGALKIDTSGFEIGDKVTVKLKVKTDNPYHYSKLTYVNDKGVVGYAPSEWGVFGTYTDWTDIVIHATVTSGATARTIIQNGYDDGSIYMPNVPISDKDKGIFLVILNMQNNTSVWIKDADVSLMSAENPVEPEDAQYSYTNNTGAFGWGAIKIDATGYNAGDSVTVKFKVKTDNTYPYTKLTYVNENGTTSHAPEAMGVFNTYTDWTEMTLTMKVVDGATVKSTLKGFWSADDAAYIDSLPMSAGENGLYVVALSMLPGTSIWVKDVEITLITNEEPVEPEDAQYSYKNNTGAFGWGAIKIDATGYNAGDSVTVKFKVKTDNTYPYTKLTYVNENGTTGHAPEAMGVFNTYTEWTEMTLTMKVVDGATVKSTLKGFWSADDAAYIDSLSMEGNGLYLVVLSMLDGTSVWIKDVTITVI